MVSRFFGPDAGRGKQAGDPFSLLQREVNRVFDEVFRGFPAAAARSAALIGGFAPDLDVRETEQGLEVAAELPGMSEQDVDLRIEGDLLTLAGEKKDERGRDKEGLHLTERSFGRFQRAFRLPFTPDPEQVQARFDKGVLHIVLPRPPQQRGGGRIPIQAGEQPQPGSMGTEASSPNPAGGVENAPKQSGGAVQPKMAEDPVDEASQESFPASDPPAWTGTTGATR